MGLVTVDRDSKIIPLVHHTAQEYFERKGLDYFPDAHKNIANTYLTYLSHYIPSGGSILGLFLNRLKYEKWRDYPGLLQRNGGLIVREPVEHSLSGLSSDLLRAISIISPEQAHVFLVYDTSSMAMSISLAYTWPFLLIYRSRRHIDKRKCQPKLIKRKGRTPLNVLVQRSLPI